MSQHMKRIAIEMDICAPVLFKPKSHALIFGQNTYIYRMYIEPPYHCHTSAFTRSLTLSLFRFFSFANFMCGDNVQEMWKSIIRVYRVRCVCNKTHPEIYSHCVCSVSLILAIARFGFCKLIFDFRALPFALPP